jgi:hypothetical protein
MRHHHDLNWQHVLLVRVTREPFTSTHCGLHVSRAHLALHPDGVVMSAWDVPEVDRSYPRIRLVGWKPMRDVPFTFPVRFRRNGDPRVSAIIPNGTWVLPYNHNRFMIFQQVQMAQQQLLETLDTNPDDPQLEWRLLHWITTPIYKSKS